MHVSLTSLFTIRGNQTTRQTQEQEESTSFNHYHIEWCPFCEPAHTLLTAPHHFTPADSTRLAGSYGNIWGISNRKRRLTSKKDLRKQLKVEASKKTGAKS
jgi:hypothetical protein